MIDTSSIETLGPKIRRERRKLGLTLDELAVRTRISKPYLSLIENDRVPNPPSDEKLRRLEQALGFASGQLIGPAHLQRTPRDVRAVLAQLMKAKEGSGFGVQGSGEGKEEGSGFGVQEGVQGSGYRVQEKSQGSENARGAASSSLNPEPRTLNPLSNPEPSPLNLDAAYISGVLQELVDRSAGNVERLKTNAVPIINRVAAGYPTDFTDLSYPRGVADDYVACPDVHDQDAFAARVYGDSMTPKYREGDIVIFSPAAVPRNGDDCFIRFADGKTTFKRVFFENGDAGESIIRLQPRNEKYRPQMIDSEQINGLWRAVFRYQSVED